jgi:hypothetical protein
MTNKLKSILDIIVEKYSAHQLRDRNGKWATQRGEGGAGMSAPSGGGRSGGGSHGGGGGGGGGGGASYSHPTTATVKRMTVEEFGKNAGSSTHDKTARAIVIGSINGPKGEGSSLSSVYASVSHATGIPQSKALADAVNAHLSHMDKNGELKVTRETTIMRHGSDTGLKAGKVKWERNADGDWQPAEMETFRISVPDKKLAATGSKINSPHTLGPRAARFDPAPGSQAEQALAFRRKEYADTRLAPQGRFHSADPMAPEMMFGDSREKLASKNKITPKEAAAKHGTDIGGKYVRHEVFGAKQVDFYDATSSVTAHIGVMTGDENSLKMSALIERPKGWTPTHHDLAVRKLGIDKGDTAKPYYTVLSGSKGSLKESDFTGFDPSKGSIKDVAKSIWTPGSYGSKAVMGGYDSMGVKVMKGLVDGGMKPELAKQTAQKMLDNFKETSLAQFAGGFKKIVKEAPENFVYQNPMSGYRMSLNKHDTVRSRIRLTGPDGKSVQLEAKIPTNVNKIKTGSGSAALFVQNWDSAVMSDLMLKNKSPHTIHDAIGIKGKKKLDDLKASVAISMTKAQDHKPLEDLAKQIIAQHKKNGTPQDKLDKHQKALDAALKTLRKSNKKYSFKLDNNHFVKE